MFIPPYPGQTITLPITGATILINSVDLDNMEGTFLLFKSPQEADKVIREESMRKLSATQNETQNKE